MLSNDAIASFSATLRGRKPTDEGGRHGEAILLRVCHSSPGSRFVGNLLGGAVNVQQQTWGQLKARYPAPGSAVGR